ncbi:adenine nucleotide alpha hydrolase [Vibrio sp. IRLE0018]|uniref:adenine nucleotide alpha hydrolase n=1 Tax=Vibrio floridensis TaxID=2908007 RepID=UPI001F22A691|nr:adenine nucleotide alpha hydrolase [Vibrio floridensis]MCF8780510.1 adenine nucleotide alpha hydrolase [Vibrio floridensis]
MKKKVVISWSSGKDSTLTLLRLMEHPDYQVVGLYTTYVDNEVPFQATPLAVVEMQAQLLNLPLIKIALPQIFPSNEVYQQRIVTRLKSSGIEIDAVAFGDMFCNGIADYRRSYIEPAGWECVFPLLGEPSYDLANEIIDRGIKTLIVTTDGHQLAGSWCGRWYDKALIAELPPGVDPCGEDGEFHTLVVGAPCFDGEISLELTATESDGRFTYQRYRAALLN